MKNENSSFFPSNDDDDHTEVSRRLEETLGRSHRTLEVQTLHVLPVLLQKRNEEVDGEHCSGRVYGVSINRRRRRRDRNGRETQGKVKKRTRVGEDLLVRHLDVSDGDTEAENL